MLSEMKGTDSIVRGVVIYDLPFIADDRGHLTVVEFERSIPFKPMRYFATFGVPKTQARGDHAHRKCEQFFVCISGSCSLMVDDGEHREILLLDRPTLGVHVSSMVWAKEYEYSENATLLVFASHHHDPLGYIRSYDEFLQLVSSE